MATLSKISGFVARSMTTFALGLALASGCGAPVETDAAQEEPPVAQDQSELTFTDCARRFNLCNTRCARLADPTLCEADCGAQLNSCYCNVAPFQCVGE